MGAFDHLKWTYSGAFEHLFGPGKGNLTDTNSKSSNAPGVARGGCLTFNLTGTLSNAVALFFFSVGNGKAKPSSGVFLLLAIPTENINKTF